MNCSCSEQYTRPQLNSLHCTALHCIYILVTLYEGELLFNIIISFCVFIYCNWVKILLFLFWCSQEKVVPLKSSSVCITLLSNRYLPSYFKCNILEGNWAMACAHKLRCALWACPGCTYKRPLFHSENDSKWIQTASSASCMPQRRSSCEVCRWQMTFRALQYDRLLRPCFFIQDFLLAKNYIPIV